MKKRIKIVAIGLCLGIAGTVYFNGWEASSAVGGREGGVSTSEVGNRLPELQELRHKEIGLGQRLFFGLEVIDEEGDHVRVELINKPASAEFNQQTLTVDWTPKASDGPVGKFTAKITEIPRREGAARRSFTKDFEVMVVKDPVKLMVLPKTILEVDALVSIIDPDRLKAANAKWDIVSMFQRIGEIEAREQIKDGSGISPSSGEQLFRDALKGLARLHKNPTIDPDSPEFDNDWDAEHWDLTAVRPRINKKVFELRLVYFNHKAAEPSYLMPRMRIVSGGDADRPDELRQKNNYTFAKKFHETFFDGEELKPFVAHDKEAYGKALESFITWVLTYEDPDDPAMRATFAALPHNSRMGGGNVYDEKGNYLHGDGWALGAFKVGPGMRDGKKVLTIKSPPIAGFVSSLKPSEDGSSFKPVPAPAVDPASDSYRQGWDTLIAEMFGTVAIPELGSDGSVSGSNIDSMEVAHEWKQELMVAETPLNDPKRRLFEEKGMTCIQCHVRNFDEGDYLTPVNDPKTAGRHAGTRPIPRVFFVIVPSLHLGRNEYIHREEMEQVGNLKGVFHDYLGIDVNINSPLAMDWPYKTTKGRS